MATLSLKNIDKIYDNNVQAVFDFNLDIADKEFIVFVGPSRMWKIYNPKNDCWIGGYFSRRTLH